MSSSGRLPGPRRVSQSRELCILLPNIELLVLTTYGTGIDVAELCRTVRTSKPGLPVLHIGLSVT